MRQFRTRKVERIYSQSQVGGTVGWPKGRQPEPIVPAWSVWVTEISDGHNSALVKSSKSFKKSDLANYRGFLELYGTKIIFPCVNLLSRMQNSRELKALHKKHKECANYCFEGLLNVHLKLDSTDNP